MRLTFFGRLRDAIGEGALDRDVPRHVGDSEALREWIGRDYPELLDPKVRIALDDVMTTGATLTACSKILVKAGAKVTVLTLARTVKE